MQPSGPLWFAFKLVSLSHWIQHINMDNKRPTVVICFQISIFEPLNTACFSLCTLDTMLWFAFKLVSLSHWIQRCGTFELYPTVVICFQISIFEPLNTAAADNEYTRNLLWFAFKLVSLSHWIQLNQANKIITICCDLLSN